MRCRGRTKSSSSGRSTASAVANLRAIPPSYDARRLRFNVQARNPVRDGLALRAVGDLVGDQAPPEALFAQPPAAEPALDDRVHLQAAGW